MNNTILNLFDLNKKTALITGASSGLGRQFCKILAQAGACVIGIARRTEKLESLQIEITNTGGQFKFVTADIADTDSLKRVLSEILQNHHVDILINNAGIAKLTPLLEPDEQLWEQHFNINSKATWLITQQVAKHMINHAIRGSIINIASINGDKSPYNKAAAYCASKAAVIQLTTQLVSELSPYNIRMNCISPGLFYTEMTATKINENRLMLNEKIPLGFVAEVDDLDGLILYLASNKASRYVTGHNFVVDGGVSANGNII